MPTQQNFVPIKEQLEASNRISQESRFQTIKNKHGLAIAFWSVWLFVFLISWLAYQVTG